MVGIRQVLACAVVRDLGAAEDGVSTSELAAFFVQPSYRGSGRGDSLLDYVEQDIRWGTAAGLADHPACILAAALPCLNAASHSAHWLAAGLSVCLICRGPPPVCWPVEPPGPTV
jgi:GNAT superfamily N-acetyltransferase